MANSPFAAFGRALARRPPPASLAVRLTVDTLEVSAALSAANLAIEEAYLTGYEDALAGRPLKSFAQPPEKDDDKKDDDDDDEDEDGDEKKDDHEGADADNNGEAQGAIPQEPHLPAPAWPTPHGEAVSPRVRFFAKYDDDEDEDGDGAPTCPQCGGPGEYIGTLGTRDQFRCRDCGWIFSEPAEAE